MRIFQHGAGLAVLTAAVFALAGCGDDDPAESSSGDSPSSSSASAAATGSEEHPTDHSTSSSAAEGANPPAAPATITIQDFAYGDPITVQPGQTITVTNMDSAEHDVDAVDGTSFMTDLLPQGGSTTFTAPTAPGTYDFTCSKHPQMLGQLIVAG